MNTWPAPDKDDKDRVEGFIRRYHDCQGCRGWTEHFHGVNPDMTSTTVTFNGRVQHSRGCELDDRDLQFTQADIDAAEKRGRAIGAANATARFSESLSEAIRQQKEIAWTEGERHESEHLATFGQFCPRGDECNPYTDTKETTP